MTPEAWRQRAEGRELCDCGEWDEEHYDACVMCGCEPVKCGCDSDGFGHWRYQVLCRDGSGEFRRARRPE